MRVKEFKLRDDAVHYHDGEQVQPGDTVHLTEAQSRAWQDKFVPVGDGDFEEMDEVPKYDPKKSSKSKGAKSKDEGNDKGPTKEAPQGQPVAAPAIHVEGTGGFSGPVDPHVMDPARQGQQSREQRQIIDSGKAPVPAVFSGKQAETGKPAPAQAASGARPSGTAPAEEKK